MGMRLEYNRTRADDFSSFASLIARCAYLIKTTMRNRQGFGLRQCSLTGRLPGPIHVDHEPLSACSVKQVLLKECAQDFHRRLIKGRKKAGQR